MNRHSITIHYTEDELAQIKARVEDAHKKYEQKRKEIEEMMKQKKSEVING